MQPLANCGYTEVITIFYLPCVPKFWGRAYFVQGHRHIWSHHYFLQQVLAHQWKISQRRFQKNSPHHQKKSPIRHETPTKHMDSKVNIFFYMKTNKTNENQDIHLHMMTREVNNHFWLQLMSRIPWHKQIYIAIASSWE